MAEINRFHGPDGRRVEERTNETEKEQGQRERVVETHVEQVPYALSERVTETTVPVVTERRKETFAGGKVVSTVVERVTDESLRLQRRAVVRCEAEPTPPPAPADAPWYSGWEDTALYVVLSAEAAFIVYQLVLRNWIG